MRLDHREKEEKEAQKCCTQCGKILGEEYPEELCPACIEMNLFARVKEFIRKNDVKECDVADHFGLPIKKVRGWIKEGRIQYKNDTKMKIVGVSCQVCGKPIDFGVMCSECHRLQDLSVITQQYNESNQDAMHFLNQKRKKHQ